MRSVVAAAFLTEAEALEVVAIEHKPLLAVIDALDALRAGTMHDECHDNLALSTRLEAKDISGKCIAAD